MAFKNRPHASHMDKLCALLLVITSFIPHLAVWAMDEAAYKAAEADKPTAITVTAPDIDFTPLVEAIEAAREVSEDDPYDETIPLDRELQAVLREACEVNNVPLCDALGLIEVESGFNPDAVSSEGCFGLMQLNPKYFPGDLTPSDNIRAGVAYLGELLEKYNGDTAAALCAYNAGHDTGARGYAKAVLAASEQWGCG